MDHLSGDTGETLQTNKPYPSLTEISVQKVIQSELSQLKDKAKVYYQQPNSNLFFLSSAEKEMIRSKRTLDELMKEYQEVNSGR